MAALQLPPDFEEFLRLLNARSVEYLIVGGYAVAIHGYPRTTGDLDIWIAVGPENARAVSDSLREFGFESAEVSPDLFLHPSRLVRLGNPPVQIEIMTEVTGVAFESCFRDRMIVRIGSVDANVISLRDLRANKTAAGRPRDLDDLRQLPEA